MAGHCLRLEKSISIHALREEGDTERPKPTLSS